MARTDNLTNYLTDVASAIKEKKGDLDTPIPASTFDDEIRNLPSGGGDIEEYISSSSDNLDSNTSNTSYNIIERIIKLPEIDLTNYAYNSPFALKCLFYGLTRLKEIPIIKLNTTNNVSLEKILYSCRTINDITNIINVIKDKEIISLNSSFYNCKNINDFSFLKELDLTKNSSLDGTFYGSEIEEISLFETSSVTNASRCFQECRNLKKIPEFNLAKCQNFLYTFFNANSLISLPKLNLSSATNVNAMLSGTKPNLTDLGGFENLGFSYNQKTTNYGQYKLDLSTCPALTHDSLMNVINNLYDLNKAYAGDPTPYTQQIVLHSDSKALLSEDEIAIATEKGWTIV